MWGWECVLEEERYLSVGCAWGKLPSQGLCWISFHCVLCLGWQACIESDVGQILGMQVCWSDYRTAPFPDGSHMARVMALDDPAFGVLLIAEL